MGLVVQVMISHRALNARYKINISGKKLHIDPDLM